MKFILSFVLSFLSLPAFGQAIDYRALSKNYFGTNTGIVTGMIGTNAVTGALTNRNQHVPFIFEGQTNGVTGYLLRSDGSQFVGPNVGQDINELNFSTLWPLYAFSMTDSNEPPDMGWEMYVVDSENYGFSANVGFGLHGNKDFPSAVFSLSAQGTNALWGGLISFGTEIEHTNTFFSLSDGHGAGVVTFKAGHGGNLDVIKSLSYAGWPSVHGVAGSVLTDTVGDGTLSWQPGLNSTAGTNEILSLITNQVPNFIHGTSNYIAMFRPNTNEVSDSIVTQPDTRTWEWRGQYTGTPWTNSITNRIYGKVNSPTVWTALQIESPQSANDYAHLHTTHGSGETQGNDLLKVQDAWIIGSAVPHLGQQTGDITPVLDNVYVIGTSSSRVNQVTAGTGGYVLSDNGSITATTFQQTFTSSSVSWYLRSGPNLLFTIQSNGNPTGLTPTGVTVGSNCYGASSGQAPQVDTTFWRGVSPNSWQMGTNNAGSAGAAATTLHGMKGSGTDHPGGNATFAGGPGTGTGRGGDVTFSTARPASGSSSAQNSFTTNFFIAANPVALTESSATLVFNIALAASKVLGMTVTATVEANDGTDFQAVTETFAIAAVAKSTTVTTSLSSPSTPIATLTSSGTLSTTWTAVANSNSVDVKCNAVSSLTQTTLRVLGYQIVIHTSGSSVITPQ